MTRSNHIDLIELPAQSIQDFEESKRFFGEVFSWKFQDWGDDYADTKEGGIAFGLTADSSARASMPLAVIYVTDLEAVRQKVIDAGGTITKEIFSFPGGRRFHFMDPAGNELAAWSE